jgi:hypothetical protein
MVTVYLFESDDDMLPILDKGNHVVYRPVCPCSMAHQLRVNIPGTVYPVMARINRRRVILHDDARTTVIVMFLLTENVLLLTPLTG